MKTLIIAFGILLVAPARAPWILHYVCDTSAPPALCHMHSDESKHKEFRSREAAISWAESNYWVKPLWIEHGKEELSCWWTYVSDDKDTDNEDSLVKLAKQVDCDTDVNLVARYCDESDCSALKNHEH
jgi:hypothetical protein